MEGETDKRVIPYLMEENGVAWPRPPNHSVDIEAYASVDNILKPGVIEAEIGASGLEALGVVVDANGDAAARWKRVSTWCGSEFSELPDRIPAEGLEVVHSRGPRFGVWIMPDNPFKKVHRTKAEIHTWLAWQDPPDLRLHEAVKNTVLDPARTESRPFVDWFKGLFRV